MRINFNSWFFTLLFLCLAIAIPATVDRGHSKPAKSNWLASTSGREFDGQRMVKMREMQPSLVFVGNSLVKNWVDEALVDKVLSPKRCARLDANGTGPAARYVLMKHQLVPSGVVPDTVMVMFKDQSITNVRVGISDQHMSWIRSEDPVYDNLILGMPATWKDRVDYGVTAAYPVRLRHDEAESLIRAMATFGIPPEGTTEEEKQRILQEQVNDLFVPQRLRRSLVVGLKAKGEIAKLCDFDYWLPRCFLPAMIDLAREQSFRLCFVRIKPRPDPVNDALLQMPECLQYTRELSAYLKQQDCPFVDFAYDPEIDISWYGPKDYLREEHQTLFTQKLMRRLPEVFR